MEFPAMFSGLEGIRALAGLVEHGVVTKEAPFLNLRAATAFDLVFLAELTEAMDPRLKTLAEQVGDEMAARLAQADLGLTWELL